MAAGWSYQDVLPYFKRAERRAEGGDEYRGGDGPLETRRGLLTNPLHAAWLEAGRQAGYALTPDMNGFQQEGFGHLDMTVGGGRRCSAANAYLRPAMRRGNLTVRTHALATRVLFERRRAVGVRYRRGGLFHEVRARREVILCAGPINSPQLLMLSGIGPRHELAVHGIDAVRELPGVGENLQDHLEFYFQVACREPITLYSQVSLVRRALIGARWLLASDGLGASNHFESGGFIRSRVGVRYPDIQFHFLPLAVNYDGSALAREHGFQAHVGPMRSQSQGWVRLRSAVALDKPRICFNYMSRSADWEEMRACVRLREDHARACGSRARSSRSRRSIAFVAARSSRERGLRPTSRSTPSSATRPRAPSTPRAPAGWVASPTPERWSIRRCASSASRRYGWSTPPSCRPSPPEISTRPPSCW